MPERKKSESIWIGTADRRLSNSLGSVLRKAGYNPVFLSDGLQIVRKLRKGSVPSLVVLDFQLTSLDGEKLGRIIKKDPRYERIPIILLLSSKARYLFKPPVDILLSKKDVDNLHLKLLAAFSALRRGESFESDMWERAEKGDDDTMPEEVLILKGRFDAVFEGDAAGVMELSPRLSVLSVNSEIEKMLNVVPLDIIGENLFRFFPHWKKELAPLLEGKANSENGLLLENNEVLLEAMVSKVNLGGETFSYFLLFREVTEREKLRRELEDYAQDLEARVNERTRELRASYEELEKMSRLKSEFLSNVSHEMRTPLTTIKGFTETLLKRRVSPEHAQEFLEIMAEEEIRLERIVNDILDITRIQQDLMAGQLVRTDFDLGEELKRVLKILSPLLTEKGIRVKTEILRPSPVINADKDRIRQVIINIIENGIKFSPRRGHIGLQLKAENDYAVLTCVDRGIGIPMKERDKVFDKFYMVDGSDKKTRRGTGVGLYIAAEIIKLHGGEIKLDKRMKKGSRFIVELPLLKPGERKK